MERMIIIMENSKPLVISPNIEIGSSQLFFSYVNAARISSGLYDFQFVFSQQSISQNSGDNVATVTLQESVKLMMSPQHAKVFLNMLQDQIQKYEANFGEIVLPDETFSK